VSLFLTPEELADLTDIRTGKSGKTREERQIKALKLMQIPFFISGIGRPKVARTVIVGGKQRPQDSPSAWSPAHA
jgi:hypothetical protein